VWGMDEQSVESRAAGYDGATGARIVVRHRI
jgi:hypothetical protein